MKILSCRINHMEQPLGFAMERATVSWTADSDISKQQEAARITVALDRQMSCIIYDSGKKRELESTGVELPLKLEPRTRYYWNVQVWGDAGDEAVSEVNWFETGKRKEAWQGEWITTPWEDKGRHPCFRKMFQVPEEFGEKMQKEDAFCARMYVAGAGLFHLEINGRKVGEEYLSPGCNALDGWVQVYTYDIGNYLWPGKNVIGVMLGNGWTKGRFGTFREMNRPYVSEFLLRAELRLKAQDGKETVITTGDDWKCAPSPVLEDGIYDGEVYDAGKEISGWSEPGTNDSEWEPAVIARPDNLGPLEDRLSLPVVIKEKRKPVQVIHTPAGEQILDMGQNMTGWIRFQVQEPKGEKIRLSYGEVLQDGNFYNGNLRSAKAEYMYISDGKKRVAEPHFTFYGFRYVRVEGLSHPVNLDDYVGCVVYSDMEETGTVVTSDSRLNRLYENAKWSQKGNFLDVPTDCPQRDERMGWSGDAQVFCKTASYNMETYAFYKKYLHDLWKEQKMCGDMVGNVIPSFLPGKSEISSPVQGGSAAWGDAAVIIPWTLYRHYGDKEILKCQYPSMKAWVDWVKEQDEADGGKRLWSTGFQFGDWLALDGPAKGGTQGGTDTVLIASAYYKYSAELLGKSAEILGYETDAEYYSLLSKEVREAIQDEFYTKNGRSAVPTQTAHVLALAFDLVSDSVKAKTAEGLMSLLKETRMHLKTGFVGTPLLCKVLSENGYSEAAYQLLFQEDYPGWLYEVKMGATTIWERWNSVMPDGKISGTGMNSLNHYAYGSVIQWMYENMCGIELLEPGYKRFQIAPETYGKLSGARARYRSPKGWIEIEWKVEGNREMKVRVRVPFDTVAIVKLPLSEEEKELSAGEYEFAYQLENDYYIGYSFADTLEELLRNPETEKIVRPLAMLLQKIPADMAPPSGLSIQETLESLSPTVKKMLCAQIDTAEMERELKAVRMEHS